MGHDRWLHAPGPWGWREVTCPTCGSSWEVEGRGEYGVWYPRGEDDLACEEVVARRNDLRGVRPGGPRNEDLQVEDRDEDLRAVRPVLLPDKGRAVDRPRHGHGPRRLPGVLGMVLAEGPRRRHPRRQARRAER
jgi:hypothetical protein